MLPSNQIPTFNLKVVVQETGLKPDTLRAWERRYGLPQPDRTSGGHRLYSQRDIEVLKWLIARQQEGMSISRAVDLWHQVIEDGKDPLTAEPNPFLSTSSPTTLGEAMTELRQAWIDACLAYDEQLAERILTQAFALYSAEIVCIELLLQGLVDIGMGWYEGEVTVQQEHFASALAIRRVEALLAAAPPPTRPNRLLVACPPEEEHTFSPLLVTLLLRRHGWNVLYLGANVPLVRMESTIETARPELVILSAQQLPTAASLLEMAELLQQAGVRLAFGGQIFNQLPQIQSRIPGHFLGKRMEIVPHKVEQLLLVQPVMQVVQPVSEIYHQAQRHFRQRQAQIEADVWQTLQNSEMPAHCLDLVNTNLARNILAALKLGDIELLGFDIDWLEGLTISYHVSANSLYSYLKVYYQAVQTHLDSRGEPVINWLGELLVRELPDS